MSPWSPAYSDRLAKTLAKCLLFIFWFIVSCGAQAQTISTVAGNIPLLETPTARNIPFVIPRGLAFDPITSTLYVSDDGSAAVRRINLATSQSEVIAGGGKLIDDLIPIPSRSANLNFAVGLALDHAGNLYLADDAHHRIRKLMPNGELTTVVGTGTPGFSGDGGPAVRAQLFLPKAIAFDAADNMYIADSSNGAIRKVDRATNIITTIAGGPANLYQGDAMPALSAKLRLPYAIALNAAGDVFFTDNADHLVYRLEVATGTLRRIAGTRGIAGITGDGGPATSARLQEPRGIAVANNGDIYIGMLGEIRKITGEKGTISTILGNQTGFLPMLEGARGDTVYVPGNVEQLVLSESSGQLFAALAGGNVIGQINLSTDEFSIRAGDVSAVGDGGPALAGALAQPNKLAIAPDGSLYVADTFHHRIRKIAPGPGGIGTGPITTVVGNGQVSLRTFAGEPASAPIGFPRGVAVDSKGAVYFTTGFLMIRRLNPDGTVETVAGNQAGGLLGDGGQAISARLNDPWAITVDSAGAMYIADSAFNRIRRVSPGGYITTIAGTGVAGADGLDGPAKQAQLRLPIEVRLDPREENLYIADQGNRRVVKLNFATGILTNVFAPINARGIAFDPAGRLILADSNRIFRVDPVTNAAEVIAGDGVAGFAGDDGLATVSRISGVLGVAVDSAGNIFFADSTNSRIRRISAQADPPRLTMAPAQLRFTASQGGSAAADQTVQLSTSNQVKAIWSATIRTQSGGSWLSLRTVSGATPIVLQVSANPAGLAVGEYTGTITIGSPSAVNSPLILNITLTITVAVPPALEVGPRLLTFHANSGGADPAGKSFTIANRGGGTLDWTVLPLTNSGGNWLVAAPARGRGDSVVSVTPQISGLRPGLYEASIRVTNNATGKVEITSVSLTVDEPGPALLLSRTGVVFTASAGSTSVPTDSFQVVNSGTGVLNWRAKIAPLSGGAWLTLSNDAGSTNAGGASALTLQAAAQIDSQNLAPGIYDSLIEISAAGVRNSPQLLLARLRVLDPDAPPVPSVQPGSIVLTSSPGVGDPQSGAVTISSSGGTNLTYQSSTRTTDGGDWLAATPASAPLTGSADQAQVVIEVRSDKLPPGFYTGQVSFSFSNGTTQEVGVLLVVPPAPASSTQNVGVKGGAALGLPTSALCEPVSQQPLVLSLTNNSGTPTAWPVGIRAAVVDNCGNPVSRSSVIAVILSGASTDRVVMEAIGEGQYAANYTLGREGNYLISLIASGSGLQTGSSSPVAANSALLPPGQSTPGVSGIGAVNGASARQLSSLAPGQIISVTGSGLAGVPAAAPTLPLPTELAGVRVIVGALSLPLYSSGSDEMDAQVPFELLPGSDLPLVIITHGNASPPQMVRIGRASPGLFTQDRSGQGIGMVANLQGQPLTPANPGHRGDEVIAYGTGLGLTDPAVPSGTASPELPPARTILPVKIFVGEAPAEVLFAGLVPGYVGLYQINFRIPADAAAGAALELHLEQDGNTSNIVTIPIQ